MKRYTLKTTEPADKAAFKIDYQRELNAEQLAVVTGAEGPCLVLAGAGSGKTRTLVYRVSYLLERGVKPNRILLVTFTNKAAKEMLNRVEVLLKTRPTGLWGGTSHHIGNRLLHIYGKKIGIEPNFTILDQEDARSLTKACVAELNLDQSRYFPKADVVHKIISLSTNIGKPVGTVVAERFSYLEPQDIEKIETIAAAYREKKRQANALDFDDLLALWDKLLTTDATTRTKLQAQFSYILVDEYQDTNYLQNRIISHLAGGRRNVLVVGDDSQSIYSFRGADVSNILAFPKVFPDCQTQKLETNYRSTPEILNLANQSIRHNRHQFEKTLKTTKPAGSLPNVVPLVDAYQQAEFVCQRIIELQQDRDVSLNDVAVLVRAHFQSLELELELNKRNIPYEMRGGLRFFEQAHIKDIVSHLKLLHNPHDELSWLRLLRLQSGIGTVTAGRIWQAVRDLSTLTAMVRSDAAAKVGRNGWREVTTLLTKLADIGTANVSALIQQVLNSGYHSYVVANFENAADRLDDLKQLVDFAAGYTALETFLADVALSEGFRGESVAGYQEGADEAVTVSTIHQAKGLEWRVVFIIGLVDGQFPHAKVFEKPAELEEERRLFYVAATRAQRELYLTYPMAATHSGTLNQTSQFIKELPETLYEKWSVTGQTNDDLDKLNDGGVSYEPFED